MLIQVVLIALSAFIAFKIYKTVEQPILYKKAKTVRYDAVVAKLKEVRKAEVAFKSVNGHFTGSWDTLVTFVAEDSLPLVRRIGSLTDSMVDAGWTEAKALEKGLIIRDTLYTGVKDSLFKTAGFNPEKLSEVPFGHGEKFQLQAGIVTTGSGVDVNVFEAKCHNNQYLKDLEGEYEQLIVNDNEAARVNNKFPGLQVGSITEANNNAGNWE
ncbi:hypothetical protein K4L44_03195 [Halosquirtibacter laminarini]|uniref:Uncharacterized protein n=1 Tax=Halosquirtibacter laminarini TaxID=3374600 RepID=A0AC61NMV8_9BACT|nr:hypothetical protein K4L44_03195 [Prolixibacteraceae bacterium]